MGTDNIGGRKFIAYCMSMAGWALVFVSAVQKGLLTADNTQSFLMFMIAIQGIFFGGNIAEKYILNKGGNGNGK